MTKKQRGLTAYVVDALKRFMGVTKNSILVDGSTARMRIRRIAVPPDRYGPPRPPTVWFESVHLSGQSPSPRVAGIREHQAASSAPIAGG
jgi:hypothetical protein